MRSDLTRRRGWNRGRREVEEEDLFGMASEVEARHLFERPWEEDRSEKLAKALPLVQGSYYLVTGLWPHLHMRSFELITGKKRDKWLVRTVGALAAAIGVGLLRSGRRGYLPRELRTVAQLAAAGFVAVEVPTALRGRISPVYLADAAVELVFIGANTWAARVLDNSGEELDYLAHRELGQMVDDGRD